MKRFKDSHAEGVRTIIDMQKELAKLIDQGFGGYEMIFDGSNGDDIAIFLDHDAKSLELEGYYTNWN